MDVLLTCSVVFGGWFLGGIIGGATGIGAIMIAMPILTTVLSPGDAVLVSCLTGLGGCVHLSWAYRRDCAWKDIRNLTIGVIPGCLIGGVVLNIASVVTLELMISAMLALFVLLQLFRKTAEYHISESVPLGIAAGIVCGIVSTSVAMVGAPLGVYALLRHWDPNRARGNMSVMYAITSLGAVFIQASSGLYNLDLFWISLIGMTACSLGQVVGVRLGRHIGRELFTRILLVFLSLAASILFARAIWG